MLSLLILVPWVLTVGALLFIIIKGRSVNVDHIDDGSDEDFFFDDSEETTIRVAVYDDKAYWVYENVFYESDVVREPDFTTARPIDTMSMSNKELTKLMVILDELKDTERE